MVMYRAFVAKHAQRLALTGHVRNLASGDVEIVAQGSMESLQTLLKYMRTGPFFAKVANIEIEWRTAAGERSSFEIRY